MDELKRCPFCGAWDWDLEHGTVNDPLAYWDEAIRGVKHGYVSCVCGAIVKGNNESDAIARWNTRATVEED